MALSSKERRQSVLNQHGTMIEPFEEQGRGEIHYRPQLASIMVSAAYWV
jgi:hypothetical protein